MFHFRYVIKSGHSLYPNDIIYNATIQVKRFNKMVSNNNSNVEDYTILNTIKSRHNLIKGSIPIEIGKISEFRIQFNSNSNTWLFIREIDLSDFET